MSSFRDQMRMLAEELANQREERKRFVAQNRRAARQLKDSVLRQREATIEENQNNAQQLHFELEQFNSLNRRRVSQTLAEHRLRRRYRAADQASNLQHLVQTIRFEVSRALSHHASDRKHNRTLQLRAAKLSMRNIRERVKEIRNDSRQLTQSVAEDLIAVRQALADFRSHVRSSATLNPVVRSQIQIAIKPSVVETPAAFSVPAAATRPAEVTARPIAAFATSTLWPRPGVDSPESTLGT